MDLASNSALRGPKQAIPGARHRTGVLRCQPRNKPSASHPSPGSATGGALDRDGDAVLGVGGLFRAGLLAGGLAVGALELLVELIDAAGGVHELDGAGVERVALRADLDRDLRPGA